MRRYRAVSRRAPLISRVTDLIMVAETMADVRLVLAKEEAADAEAGRLPFGALEVTESSFLSAGFQLEEAQYVHVLFHYSDHH